MVFFSHIKSIARGGIKTGFFIPPVFFCRIFYEFSESSATSKVIFLLSASAIIRGETWLSVIMAFASDGEQM